VSLQKWLPVVLGLVCASASAQDHGAHVIPVVPATLLEHPVSLQEGVGRAHDRVGTRSPEAQRFYDQGLNYLHGYVWIEAARSFHQALRIDPTLAVAHVGLSIAYVELNQGAAARAALERAEALAAAATPHDRWHIDARVAQAAAEMAPGNRATLMAYRSLLDRALAAEPRDAEFWILRGTAESSDPADRGQGSPASAIPYFEKAIALGGVSAQHHLTHALENSGRIVDAIPHAEAFAASAPAVPHALHMKGHVLRRAGRIDEAVTAFEAADRVETAYFAREQIPPEYDWHYEHNLDLLASSYRYLGQMRRADEKLQAAFNLPSSLLAQMYNKRVWPESLIAQGRFDAAVEAADRLVAHPSALVRATGHIEAGLALLAAGRVQVAVDRANRALAEMRASPGGQDFVAPALQQLQGLLYLTTGARDRGRAMLESLSRDLRARPGPDNWVQALFTLESISRGARQAGDWEFAGTAARQMLALDPGYAGSHYALALVLEQAGDGTGAKAEFAAATRAWLHADPDLPDAVRAARGAR
jgi:tetratricopeptide (TPR) repeat protein